MIRKIVLVIVSVIPFLGCDDDFRQGRYDEVYFEQTDGNGGFLCAPVTEEGLLTNLETDSYD